MKWLLVALVVVPLVSANYNVFQQLMKKHGKRGGGACMSDPCNGQGDCCDDDWCSTDPKGYMCWCYTDYTGANCELESPCKSSPCLNGGWCCADEYCAMENPTNGFVCYCSNGYTGETCDVLGYCIQNPDTCNGGYCCDDQYCTDYGNKDYTCYCDSGKAGKNCELDCDVAGCTNDFWDKLYAYPSEWPDWKPKIPYQECIDLVNSVSTCMANGADTYCNCDHYSLQSALDWDDEKQIYIDEYCDQSTRCNDDTVQDCVNTFMEAAQGMDYGMTGQSFRDESKPTVRSAIDCLVATKDMDKTGCGWNTTIFDYANTISIVWENLLEDCDLMALAENCYHFDFDELMCGGSSQLMGDFADCVLANLGNKASTECPSVPRDKTSFLTFLEDLFSDHVNGDCEGFNFLATCPATGSTTKRGMSKFRREMIAQKMANEKAAKQRRTSQLQNLVKLLKARKLH